LGGNWPSCPFLPCLCKTRCDPAFTADGRCNLHGLASICSGSKQLCSNCLKLLREQPLKQAAAQLLAGVEEAVYAATAALQERSCQSVWWLLDTALPHGFTAELLMYPSLVGALTRIPNFPLQLAEGLCQRGLCVSYKDIAAAARGKHRVAGRAHIGNVHILPGSRHLLGMYCCRNRDQRCCSLLFLRAAQRQASNPKFGVSLSCCAAAVQHSQLQHCCQDTARHAALLFRCKRCCSVRWIQLQVWRYGCVHRRASWAQQQSHQQQHGGCCVKASHQLQASYW
jgi:hypothetical protein